MRRAESAFDSVIRKLAEVYTRPSVAPDRAAEIPAPTVLRLLGVTMGRKEAATQVPVTDSIPVEPRELLIALNLRSELGRGAGCRLAAELDRWAGRPAAELTARLARRLGVAPEALLEAGKLRREAAELAARESARAAKLGARILTRVDGDYPRALFDLALPPPVLYVQGELPAWPGVTVVGSRQCDLYGREVAELFGRELAAAGALVISGLAYGVDAAAHRGALAAEGGSTAAVLGCGLGVDYPPGHRDLAAKIAERGALLSEFPPGTPPARWQFPVRNRILAALAQAVVVVRAAARSGSLITVRYALELGRDIYAVPGRIFDRGAEGPNGLIREGAFLVQHPREILEHLDPPLSAREVELEAPPSSSKLLRQLPPAEERTVEELAEALKKSVAEIYAELLELELEGRVRRLPGGGYARRLT